MVAQKFTNILFKIIGIEVCARNLNAFIFTLGITLGQQTQFLKLENCQKNIIPIFTKEPCTVDKFNILKLLVTRFNVFTGFLWLFVVSHIITLIS